MVRTYVFLFYFYMEISKQICRDLYLQFIQLTLDNTIFNLLFSAKLVRFFHMEIDYMYMEKLNHILRRILAAVPREFFATVPI